MSSTDFAGRDHGRNEARRWPTLPVILLLITLGWVAQGSRALWEPDEGRYSAVAVQMVRSGDWLAPHLNHETPHFSKPPLVYWLIAGSIELLGRSETAVRLPNALAWLAMIAMMMALAKRLTDRNPLLGPIVFCTSLFPFVAVNIVTTDFILTAAECLSVLGFVLWWKDRASYGLWVMWTGFGVAFLVKGPPALLPLLPILVFGAMERMRIWRIFLHPGLVAFLVIGLGWYVAAAWSRPDLLDYWLGTEVAGRVSGSFSHRNEGLLGWVKPYVPVILVGMMPWTALVPFRRWKGTWQTAEDRFLILWIAIPLSIFILASSRMPLYLLPLTVPAAILLARRLPAELTGKPWIRGLAIAWLITLVTIKVGGAVYSVDRDPRPLAKTIERLAGAVDEVHFVDMNGWYGLTFYLDVEVEQITMKDEIEANPDYRPVWEKLNDELEEDSNLDTVYVVPRNLSQEFERMLAERRWSPASKTVEEASKLVIYASPLADGRDSGPR